MRVAERSAGGDNEVPRDGMKRPLVMTTCQKCEGAGRLPSEKKPPPATIQCGRCKGEKATLVAHTRTTTFIDVLEDKSNLMAWKARMTLIGVALDPTFINGVTEMDPENKADKDKLNRLAESAQVVAGSEVKSSKGTFKHGLSELVDQGEPLPDGVSFGDVIDMDAYRTATRFLFIRYMEKLVVNEQYRVAGTPDRVSRPRQPDELDPEFRDAVLALPFVRLRDDGVIVLLAPDGSEIGPDELVITDLKTGTVDYGALKMAMQLAMYANSVLYDHKTHERKPMEGINRKWGIIMNAQADSGGCVLYWADLTLGWEAVEVAHKVRELRRRGKRALMQFAS